MRSPVALALALALLLHGLLLFSVFRHPPRTPVEAPAGAMVWLKVAPPAPPRKPAPPPVAAARPPDTKPKAKSASAAPPIVVPEAPVAEAPPVAPSADTILSIAKRDLAKIDQQLREESGKQPRLSASAETALQRLARGIDQAHQAAPNRWYQAARIEDITPPGDDARKIYRIATALGTYCVHYKDKNRPGVDHGQANSGEALIGACPHMF
jgi:hypothetical protein